ncbi:MAG: pilus assembly protein PilM [Anaerolineaceae bacterium]|nr:pilus assembly protein PilM [Anaerolineaceae bacterium]
MKKILPIGIDIGTCSVKMVQLAVNGDTFSVVACAKAELPDMTGMAEEGREALLASRIMSELKEHKFRGKDCIAALMDSEVSIRNIRIPCVGESQVEDAVLAEAKFKFPFDIEDAVVNFMIAGQVHQGDEAYLEVLLFAAPKAAIEAHVARLHAMGLVPASLDAQHCALFRTFERYLRRKEDEGEVNVYLDLGGTTKVIITRGRDILFIKSINKGALSFDAAVASRLELSLSEASALRHRVLKSSREGEAEQGEQCDREVRQMLFDAIRPEIEELAEEINKCLRYHSVTFRGERPAHVTFIGGETHESGIPEMLGKRIGLPVIIGEPFRGINTKNLGADVDRRGMLSEWTVAFGLSLKGAFIRGIGLGHRLAG